MNKDLKTVQAQVGLPESKQDGFFGPTTAEAIARFCGMNIVEASHFLGQGAIETGWYTSFEEGLNYSSEKLQKYFSAFRDPLVAKAYERQPERIANRAYANRGGNGPESSGDGWKYRGRGILMTSLFDNYVRASRMLAIPAIVVNPELLKTTYALDSALAYWTGFEIPEVCTDLNRETSYKVTRLVNGPGMVDKKERFLATLKIHSYLTSMNYSID